MRQKMGLHHSSFSCARLSTSLHNCFSFASSSQPYEAEPKRQNEFSNSEGSRRSSCDDDVASSQPIKKTSQKNLTESCCCKGVFTDKDDFSYNICNQSDSQITANVVKTSTSSSSLTQSRRSSDCPRDRKSSADLPLASKLPDLASEPSVQSNLAMDSVTKPKSTVVLTNGKDVTIKAVARTNSINETTTNNISRSSAGLNSNSKHHKLTSVPNEGTASETLSELEVEDSESRISNKDHNSVKNLPVDVYYFRNLLSVESERLNESINEWNHVLRSNSHCPAEVCDEIRTVIGQTRLVISERFTQFSKLVDRADVTNQVSTDDRPVLISDLQGFWDMIYFQVQDVDAKFVTLGKLRANQWKQSEVRPSESKTNAKPRPRTKAAQTKRPVKKKTQSSEEDRKRREAARKRVAEARKALAHRNQVEQDSYSPVSEPAVLCSPAKFVTDASEPKGDRPIGDVTSDDKKTHRRPESIVDAITCAVAVTQVNADTTSLSSMSSTSLVH